MQPSGRENEGGKLLLGYGAHPTPGPSSQACLEAPAAGGEVLTSVTVTPGKGRALRQEPGRQAAAAKPGRSVPVNAAVTLPGCSVPPARAGETPVRLLWAAAEGSARPAVRSVSTGSRERHYPQRSGRTRRGAGLEGSGALPCLGPPLHGGPR